MTEAYIAGIGTALPRRQPTDAFLAIDREMRSRHGQPPEIADTVARLARGSGVQARHGMNPAWFADPDPITADIEDIFTPTDFDPEFWQRMRLWRKIVPTMSALAAKRALEAWGGSPADISHIITTNTGGWSEPGIACHIIDELGLPDDCAKADLNFNGCFCGATCMRLARDIVRGGESRYVLVTAAEAPTIHYSPVDTDTASLVANVLFGDGAAAMIIGPEGAWRFDRAGMRLVPNSRHLLTADPPLQPQQQNYRMFLHREVGASLGAWFRDGGGQELLAGFTNADGTLPALAVHPGGPNILENVDRVLRERGYPDDVLAPSFATLHAIGNLGSAAILFVLARMLPELEADHLCSLAFGPGVTVEWGMYSRA